ncbi:MAG: hypothetical protein V4556_11835 [Bacteroidota bacterium]
MKKIIFALALLVTVNANAQKEGSVPPAKAIYFELGGPGIASLNYDMRFSRSESGLGGRIGIGGFSLKDDYESVGVIFVPVGINYLIGKDNKNYFELGAGFTYVSSNESSNYYDEDGNFRSTFGHLNFGYRLQPANGGFFFRAAINPVFGKGFFIPYYGGLAFGYKF